MKRRDFIKNSIITTCGLCTLGNCGVDAKLFEKQDDLEKKLKELGLWENEIYKSKEDLPKKIRIDACSMCQLNCAACWMREDDKEIEKQTGFGYLRFKNFKRLVDDNPQIEEIELSNNGEIFLNPELLDIIKYGYEKNIILRADNGVNLNTLSDEMAEALVKYQFKSLILSIDGASHDIYKIYRRGGNFNTVIGNIKKIQYYQKKYNSEYPKMIYKFIVFGHNEHEIPKAKELAKELGIEIFFRKNFVETYSPVKDEKFVAQETGLEFGDNEEEYNAKKYKEDKSAYIPCTQLWDCPQINWDGRLMGCCSLYKANFGVNVFKEGLLNALNSPQIVYAKNMLSQKVEPAGSVPCATCGVYLTAIKYDCEITGNRN